MDGSDKEKVHVEPHFPVFWVSKAQHVRKRCQKREGDKTRASPYEYEIPARDSCWIDVVLS